MKVICPSCKKILQGTEKSLGHKAICPKCKTVFRVAAEHCPDLTKGIFDNSLNDSTFKSQTKWAVVISAVGLTCAATLLITVFVMRSSSSYRPEISPKEKEVVSIKSPSKASTPHQKTVKNASSAPSTSNSAAKKIKSQIELSITDLVEKVDGSICKIESGFSSGTGFLVAPGIVATNAHIVGSWNDLNCYFPGNYNASKAQIIWFNPDVDIAFLSVNVDIPPLESKNSDDAKRGEKVIVIGYPGTVGNSVSSAVTTGILSNRTSVAGIFYHQIDAAINLGNSGGPVFDIFGKVIGIATLKETNKENIGYVLPFSYVFSEYSDLCKSNPQERAFKLAQYVRNSDVEAIGGGKVLVVLMLADIESAWSDAITYNYDFQRAVQNVSETHGRLAELTTIRMQRIETNLVLYKQTLSERQINTIIGAKNIIVEACNFVKSPSGNYRRFEQYWPTKVSQLEEATRILKSITN